MLNTYQLAGLQNELAKVAAEKLALEFDPSEPARFQQSEAFLRGQQTMLTYLVARSEQYSTDQPLAQSEGQGGESTDWD